MSEQTKQTQIMCLKCGDNVAKSADPDQTAPNGAVWSRSTLFAKAWLHMFMTAYASKQFEQTFSAKTREILAIWSGSALLAKTWLSKYLGQIQRFEHV